ncbi:MAG: phosphoglycerate dehydrogenase [Streptosporangiaceae bacterium]
MDNKPVVLVAEEISPSGRAVLEHDFEVRATDGADRARLLAALPDAEALIVRSATRVDSEVFETGRHLRVVARAGVGLDNVDVGAATKAGVMVVNAPQSNIVSAAEHTVGLLLACLRNIPRADAALRGGEWKRSAHTGVELAGKVVGIVGLGRVGALVAERLSGFGVRLIAYDPYIPASRAAHMGVRLVGLEELLRHSDVVTVHMPKSAETVGFIGERELRLAKPTAYLVNASRGGIVDEHALAVALKEGRLAGAALDVFADEPCTDSPLFEFDNVVETPHLGASTREAQEKAGLAAARSVRLALAGEFVPDAVNVQGGAVAEDVRPYLPLAETLGQVFTALAGSVAARLDVEVRGEIVAHDVAVLELGVLKGLFAGVVEEAVTYVNAPLLAKERTVEVNLVTSEESQDFRNLLVVRGILPEGTVVSVSGTIGGPRHVGKIVDIDGFDVDVLPTAHMAFFTYYDRPGVVGVVGRILGDEGINIAGMQVSRGERGGEALVALTVDSTIPPGVLDTIVREIGAFSGRTVDLVE